MSNKKGYIKPFFQLINYNEPSIIIHLKRCIKICWMTKIIQFLVGRSFSLVKVFKDSVIKKNPWRFLITKMRYSKASSSKSNFFGSGNQWIVFIKATEDTMRHCVIIERHCAGARNFHDEAPIKGWSRNSPASRRVCRWVSNSWWRHSQPLIAGRVVARPHMDAFPTCFLQREVLDIRHKTSRL